MLITFDEARTRAALAAIADVAAQGIPVVLFTHHAHVANLAGAMDDGLTTVVRLPAVNGATSDAAAA